MIPILYETIERFAVQERPQVYLEIGVREGDSLAALLSVHTPEMLLLCDNWSATYGGSGRGSHAHIDLLLQNLKYEFSVLYFDGDSVQTVPTIGRDGSTIGRDGSETRLYVDMALVDGDHSARGCALDMINVWNILAPNGLMIVDDIAHPAHMILQDVVSDFVKNHLCKLEFSSLERQGVAVLRKIERE